MSNNDLEQAVEQSLMNESSNDSTNQDKIEEALSRLVDEMSSTEQLALFSDLSEKDIKNLSVLETMDDPLIDKFAENFKSNRISKNRRGRKDLKDMAEPFADAFKGEDGRIDQIKEMMSL